MKNKEKNFISAIIYLQNNGHAAVDFLKQLYDVLESNFESFELIAIDNSCTDETVPLVRRWAENIIQPLSLIHMSLRQSKEVCMNAGLDASIGDYVYEFDQTEISYDPQLIFEAYQTATAGSDIVSVCPDKMNTASAVFYKIFNANSNSAYYLRSASFRLLSRRAINRVHATSKYLPYRKAAYASSGLKLTNICYNGKIRKEGGRISLAIDSLILYTEAGVRVSFGITILMFLIALCGVAYVIFTYCTGQPIEGWTTTMLVITFGLAGVFTAFTIVIKYLSLILDLVFRKQKYFVESIEKIQK